MIEQRFNDWLKTSTGRKTIEAVYDGIVNENDLQDLLLAAFQAGWDSNSREPYELG